MHDDRLVLHARHRKLLCVQAEQGRGVAEEDLLVLRDAHDVTHELAHTLLHEGEKVVAAEHDMV